MPNLTFSDEGPQYYGLAYARNRPMAKPGPYFTKLSPHEETQFRQWLKTTGNPSKFDPDAKIADYDMRGYWKEVASKGKNLSGINTSDMRLHFPDTYKTPYDTTFSGESRYALPNLPTKWVDSGIPGRERLINTKTGEVLYQKKQLPVPSYPGITQGPVLRPASGMGPPAPVDYRQSSLMNPAQQQQSTSDIDPVLQQVSNLLALPQEVITRATLPGATAMLGTKYGPPTATMLGMALPLSFGDPEGMASNITKEQREAWEAENAAYRQEMRPTMPTGSRVMYRPGNADKFARDLDRPLAQRTTYSSSGKVPGEEGVVVMPGTPEAGTPGDWQMKDPLKPPGSGYIAVRDPNSKYWFWRHRDNLEVLRPEEKFQIGDKVKYEPNEFEATPNKYAAEGVIAKPPPNAPPSPGPDYVWADISKGKPTRMDAVRYKGGTWGGWFHKSYFTKQGK